MREAEDVQHFIRIFNRAYKEGLRVYGPSVENDLLLVRWYEDLRASGDLEKTFTPATQCLSVFLNLFSFPSHLLYQQTESGVESDVDTRNTPRVIRAFWLVPASPGVAYCGVWLMEGVRFSPRSLSFLQACYSFGFTKRNVLLGKTKQMDLLPIHEKLGYTVVGKLALGWDGVKEDAWIVELTRESFETSILNPYRGAKMEVSDGR